RERAKRVRPTSQAPEEGWLLTELAQLTGIPVSTVQYYVRLHLLRPLQFRGTATRYPRRELLTLLGLRQLEANRDSTLTERKRRLDKLTEPELENLIDSGSITEQARAALSLESAGLHPLDDKSLRNDPAHELGGDTIETWQRISLLPGLELMLRADAKPVVQAVAQRICSEYSTRDRDEQHGLE
ncbi:MAG TPA: MerR family transcriptional regulator, partial [Polyangiaceae bacterium]|nr:MerR family transcriptional regulator [Polyangiaceae bacterium]